MRRSGLGETGNIRSQQDGRMLQREICMFSQDLEDENRRLGEKILKIQVLLHEQPIKNQARFENSTNKFG